MWPKLLDLTHDECRGALRRLELESYSNVVGAFRAQGTLNAVKLRILKDLRDAFHISDARHKAEVRRVVNDESLSTIAKMIYGPNSEIEWNKEGSRGFLIINRKPSQTALAAVADKASELGETLNRNLKPPSDTQRDRVLEVDNDANVSDKIVDTDPSSVQPKAKSKPEKVIAATALPAGKADANRVELSASATKKQRESNKTAAPTEQPAVKTPATDPIESSKASPSPKVENVQMPKPITANSRRRKSTTSLANHNAPQPKAMLLTNRRDTMIETSRERLRESYKIESLQAAQPAPKTQPAPKPQPIVQQQQATQPLPPPPPPPKPIVNEVRVIPKEITVIRDELVKSAPIYTQNTVHRSLSSEGEVQVIEAIVPAKVETIKGTRNVMNAISQGAQLVKVIDSKIIKKPVNLSNMYVKSAQNQQLKVSGGIQPTAKQTFTSNAKASNVEYLTVNDCARPLTKPATGKVAHKIQVIASDAPQMINSVNVIQRTMNHSNKTNDFISIPTARNPNIVKTSDKTIMHVSPHLPQQQQYHHHHSQQQPPPKAAQVNKKPTTIIGQAILTNHMKYPQQTKHVVQIVQQTPQTQSRTVTIHPNSTILKALPSQLQVSTINEMPAEYVYEEQVNDWQNYDPTMANQNGYVKIVRNNAPNNGRDYQNHASNIITENIVYDEDIITEEYITTDEFNAENVIEMEVADGFS